jgi:RNA-directed DNA polymerase
VNRTRQNNQQVLALEPKDRGEAPARGDEATEPFMAKSATENSAFTEQLMEEVCDRENLERAWKRVQRNKGSPGVDGMTIDDAKEFLHKHWPNIRSQLLDGNYQPQPVKRVEIPKPDGGVRKLGVPSVVDRLIQQAVLQVLQERWDPTFSEHSYQQGYHHTGRPQADRRRRSRWSEYLPANRRSQVLHLHSSAPKRWRCQPLS